MLPSIRNLAKDLRISILTVKKAYDELEQEAYIKTDSKWCNEKISNPENYTKCNSYSKKKAVGLLSVADINNSKGEDGSYNILNTTKTWTSNISSSSKTSLTVVEPTSIPAR